MLCFGAKVGVAVAAGIRGDACTGFVGTTQRLFQGALKTTFVFGLLNFEARMNSYRG